MLQKWKCILTNWINCYFNESSKKEQNVSLESILSIISHLRENLNLDESTSSILEAQTLEEFIVEKYPDFKFENGSVEPTNEEEIYIAVSLLLFFVCVISKDVDIKNAMCSKLSFADQEVIMKFSKCLMVCSPICNTDVKTAIAEACGQESASVGESVQATVAETPPALRSLHSEVRRLQAALDAERFDKNYLQEELTRTNLKLEKLLKDKEQYKLDILNLKAKISLCCGQEAEANGAEKGGEGTTKLLRQLQQMEEKLVETQGQLDDTQYERDTYKAKIDELKQERNKLLTYSEQESSRVSQLTEELDVERRQVQSLRDLVTELRQHNQLNRLNSSQVECDDPDTSIHSVQNLSVCSEVCANVVEVQLGEERAKIVVLKQQIQNLQDELNDLRKKNEDEKQAFEDVMFEKDNELLNLRHRINEEIEKNNILKAHFSDEVSKLNNEINELEQKLKDNTEHSRQIIQAKMQDIQTLQEEKLSLLQSLSNETTKLDNVIKGLNSELHIEKNAKLSMRDDYENHIMKLNEKILNRNNELVELQNKISESSEQLEDLQSQLRKERKTNQEIIEKYNLELDQLVKEKIQITNMLQQKVLETEDLKSQHTLHIANIEELKKNVETNQGIIQKYSLELEDLEKRKIETANMLQQKIMNIEELQSQQIKNMAYIEGLNKELNDLKVSNQNIIEKRNSEVNRLEKQNKLTTNKLEKKDLEIGELQNQITRHIAYTEELTTNIANLKESLKEEKLQGAKVLEQKVLEIRELQNQLSHNHSYIETLCKNIEDLKESKRDITEKFSLELKELKQEKIHTSNILEENILKIEELQIQLSQNIVYIDVLNNNIDDLKVAKQEIIEKYTLDLELLNKEKNHIADILQEKLLEINELRNQLTQNVIYNEELKRSIEDLNTTNQDIIKEYCLELEQLKQEKIQTRNILEVRDLEMKELQNQLALNKTYIDELNKNIDDLKTTNQSIINRYNMELGQIKDEKLQSAQMLEQKVLEIGELEKQNNAITGKLTDEIRHLKESHSNAIENYNSLLEKLKDENTQSANLLQEKILEIKKIQIQLVQNNANTEELKRNINELKTAKQEVIQKYCLELDQLKEEKLLTSNILQQKTLQIEKLQNQLTKSNASTEELNKTIHDILTRNQDIIESYTLELDRLNNEKVQTANILEQNALKIKELQMQLSSNAAHIEDLKKNIEESKIVYGLELEQLKEERAQTSKISQQKEAEIEELQKQISRNNASIEELNNNIKVLKTDKQDLIEKHYLELEQLKEEKSQILELLQQKNLQLDELQNLSTQNDVNTVELNKNIENLKSTKQDIVEKYSFELEQLKQEMAQISDVLQQKGFKIEELQNLLTQNDASNEELSKNIEELKAAKQNIIEKYNLELKLLKEEKAEILQQKDLKIEELQNLLAQKTASTEELYNNIKVLKTTKQDLIEKHYLELEQLKEEKSQTFELLQQKDLQLEELQNLLTQNDVNTVKLFKNIEDLKSTKQDIVEKYSFELEQLKQEKAQTSDVLQQKGLKIEELQNLLTQNYAINEELSKNIEELKAAKQDIIEKYNLELKLLKEEKIELSKTLEEKVLEIKELQIQLTNNKERTEKLYKTIDDLEARICNMDIELTQLKVEKAEAVTFLEQKVLEIKNLTQNIDDLNARNQDIIQNYSLKLGELKDEKIQATNILQQKDFEIKELRNQLTQSNSNIDKLKDNIDELKITNEDSIKKYTLELQELKEEKVKANNSLEQKLLKIGELQNQLKNNIANIEGLNKNIDDLKGTNDEITKQYNLELDLLKEKNVQADNILKQKDLKIEELQNQLIHNKVYIEELNINTTTANQDTIKKYSFELEELQKENMRTSNILQQKLLETQDLQKELTLNKAYTEELNEKVEQLKSELQGKVTENVDVASKNKKLTETVEQLVKEKSDLERIKLEYIAKITELEDNVLTNDARNSEELSKLKQDNAHLIQIIEENRTVITNMEQLIKHELERNQQLREENGHETMNLTNKCSLLQEYQMKAEKELDEREKEITTLKKEAELLKNKLETYEHDLKERDAMLSAVIQEKDIVIGTISKELVEEKEVRERCQKELEARIGVTEELRHKLEVVDQRKEELKALRKENEELVTAAGQRETFAVNQEKTSHKYSGPTEKDIHAFHYQVDNTSDLTHSSLDSIKTISDLEKIIHDKNRTITTLQSDVTYMKSLMADSENKLLDVTKELELSKENCQQLSAQLKKIVQQKNEELADLRKQVSKMSVTENRATEIIKVSAKYQAIILKRIAEIKNNTVLKELTNFGNTANGDNELRRSLNAGTITMEDLENFLETTDRHLRRCSEKQQALQKERDRLIEVNRINESEIINMKKFLTELSVSFKTFNNIKDLYMQKFSKVVSVQRTVRREILNLDGQITDAAMCKLERGYAAVMQDLSECSMNMERWVERSIGRTISAEKIKQAFSSDNERTSITPTPFQNTSLEIQLDELEKSFQKLLEEVSRARKGEGAKDAQAITVMEVRAEYEDKLNRMKAKMKQLYQEQIAVFKEKQKEEMAVLEREVQRARDNLAESSRAYEEHIRSLTTELWSVGEKFLMKKDEAEWLRRKQRSGSLMSLQHVHSSGLMARPEEASRPSDTHSLRSLPVNSTNNKREGRGLHMSDEEGEVFDNRCLKELSSTPQRPSSPPREGQRLSELRWRNSLCPPHLKSSYPAETQFAQAIDEDEIKCFGASGKQQRKEVGITAYKKPGPPTPSKQAGRLSATDSELRESLRVEADPQPSRKTSTPSRLRALFRSGRNDTADGTPRTKRLSFFRKK